jgi:hypothetical protein
MSLRIRFHFDGKCSLHPRYDPARDGRPQHSNCEGCESLYVIHLYTKIAKRRVENSNGIVARFSASAKNSAPLMTPHSFQKAKILDSGNSPA